jgi:RNA 2',3'-cyclic 3'-phosphodiesterase
MFLLDDSRSIRVFLGVEISDPAKEELLRVIDILKKKSTGIKWASPGTIHITIKFLGDITESKERSISEILKREMAAEDPFDIVLGSIGVFPGWRMPRTMWVGISSGEIEVRRIERKITSILDPCGFQEEKRVFVPHITIGRVKGRIKAAPLKNAASEISIIPKISRITHVTLFRSYLTPVGAVHTPVERFPFRP